MIFDGGRAGAFAGEIDLFLVAKKPGPALEFDVARASIPLASLLGDRSLFTRPDGLAAVWQSGRPAADQPALRPRVRARLMGAGARELIAPGQWLLGQ